ncbi:hypothetical protein DITRI_Ditri19aG0018900 [Diplodiscus trichospermus]
MKMGSAGLVSIFRNGCRSLSAPVSLLRMLTSIDASSLHKHKKSIRKSTALSCLSSSKRHLSCLSSKGDVALIATTTSVNGYPEYHRLLPCPSQNGPPRVEHLVVSEGGHVLEYICKALDLPPLFVNLIHFGAVYYALVCPQPPPSATPEQIRIFKEVTAPSVLSKRASIKGKTVREAQKTFRITHVDQFVEAGTYLRVHVHPKRFPRRNTTFYTCQFLFFFQCNIIETCIWTRCYEIDWKSRIIAVTDSYVVLDKPAGTSVGGTTDNIEESCATFATPALGFSTPLMTTHQIDNCTEGCVVLARTKEYCSVFHGKIRILLKDGTCVNLRLCNAQRSPGQIPSFKKTMVLKTLGGL